MEYSFIAITSRFTLIVCSRVPCISQIGLFKIISIKSEYFLSYNWVQIFGIKNIYLEL